MESLKELISSRKAELKKKLDNRGWVSQSEVRDHEREECIKRQRERDATKVKKCNIKDLNYSTLEGKTRRCVDKSDEAAVPSECGGEGGGSESHTDTPDHMKSSLPIQVGETMSRLRQLGEPITLFGEDDCGRYNRLKRLEFQGRTNEEMNIGQQNIFLHGFDANISLYSISEGHANVEIYDELELIEGEGNQRFILRWIEAQLKEWEQLLKCRTKAESETEKGRQDSAQYYQTKRDIQPLVSSLEKSDGKVDKDVLDKLFEIVELCNKRDYNKAQDKYIELAIGNAPWPMGVTMVGIHERAGRTKIFSSHIAHVLNDETTRKYIQMFKRLVTHCESKRPSRELHKQSI
ncbi:PRP18 domain-containing protein [Cryptosporidium canis]|uniref:Pre-mRNA-splicing factor 18 n=1 Tax=Cryptosporidium canis TaxID=195482 RepID=A0ABQ8PA37_9CRYT|nr:PRP18 domain-containing protein [Cryptosporidium canis]KAJ1614296.1 PRP18 domain-containing protein [Cryptosporidium canis]